MQVICLSPIESAFVDGLLHDICWITQVVIKTGLSEIPPSSNPLTIDMDVKDLFENAHREKEYALLVKENYFTGSTRFSVCMEVVFMRYKHWLQQNSIPYTFSESDFYQYDFNLRIFFNVRDITPALITGYKNEKIPVKVRLKRSIFHLL